MAQTANYNLEKPNTANNVDEEFYQFQETLDLLDSILAALQTAVNGKSAVGHTHAIADVLDLAAQLAAKMPASQTFKLDDLTDVSGADGAPDNYVLVKSALGWIPSSALAALGTHGHLISEITGLVAALAGKSDVGHTHAIADTTGLQTALDAKAPLDLSGLTAKTAPVDADLVGLGDSAASFGFKKLTFANLKAWILSFAGINLASAVTTTSGTSVDFTGIPSNAKRITLNLYGISTNGSSDIVVQMGTSSGVEAFGYAGTVSRVGTAAVASIGATGANFATIANNLAAASAYFGKVVFERVSGNLWTIVSHISTGNDNQTNTSVFAKTTASALDRVRLTTAGGANTFDTGTAAISWET